MHELHGSKILTGLSINGTDVVTCKSYVRMVLRQHASVELKRLLLKCQRIMQPPQRTARGCKTANRRA